MKCPACGADNREGANFCRLCGNGLVELSPGEMLPTAEVVEAPPDVAAPVAEVAEDSSEEQVLAGEVAEARLEEPATEVEPVEGPVDEMLAEAETAGSTPTEPTLETEAVEAPAEDSDVEMLEADAFPDERTPEAEDEEASPEALVAEIEESGVLPGEQAPEAEVVTTPDDDSESVEMEGAVEGGELKPLPEVEGAEPEQLAPVAPGEVIAGRYVVAEVLSAQEDEILYHAHDLQRCWQCGFEANDPEDTFCAQCGASLDRKPDVRLLEVRQDRAEPSDEEAIATRLSHEDRLFLLLVEPEPEAQALPAAEGIRLVVGQRSDTGQVRDLNEDSLLALILTPNYASRAEPVFGLFAVADGMGGHEGGEVASKMALQALAEAVSRTIMLPELAGEPMPEDALIARLQQATIAANDGVYLARQKRQSDMGTTLTAALVRDDRLFLAHVGDCRAYRWNADGLEQLTTDHSLVASMVASGQAEPEEIYTHPHRSVVLRCIGDQPLVEVDSRVVPLAPSDRILLCSDGLWEMLRDEGIEDVMLQEADPQAACDLLVNHANMAGGDDNISVIVVHVAEA